MSDLSHLGDFADVLQCEVGVGIACVQNAFFLHPFSSQLPITWVSFGGVQLGIWPPYGTEGYHWNRAEIHEGKGFIANFHWFLGSVVFSLSFGVQ